jgi:hypothetical protein
MVGMYVRNSWAFKGWLYVLQSFLNALSNVVRNPLCPGTLVFLQEPDRGLLKKKT